MDMPPKTWREQWDQDAENPVPDPLVEMSKRMRRRVDAARDAADDAARHAFDQLFEPIPSPNRRQSLAFAEEIVQRSIQVIEEWRQSRDPSRSQLLGRAICQLKSVIEHAARDQEPVEPAATVEG